MKIDCKKCGKLPLLANGLCSKCYQREYRLKHNPPKHLNYKCPCLRPAEKGYLAGLIDGEGSISKYQFKKNSSWAEVKITIINTNLEVLEWTLKKLKCGSIHDRKLTGISKKPIYSYQCSSRIQIGRILRVLIPYLIIKKKKAKELLKWINQNPFRGYHRI